MDNHRHNRSLFWPFVLVGVGIIWLLSNLNVIPAVNIGTFAKLWPLLLVVLGLDILFGRRSPWLGGVIGLLAIAGVIGILVFSPSLGIDTGSQMKSENFSAPLDQTTAAKYWFETSSDPVQINALSDSTKLINADLAHLGTIRFEVTGTTTKAVRISESNDSTNWFNWDFTLNTLKWDIGLAPNLPSDIVIDGGSGSLNIDLAGIMLQSLRTDFGSGASTVKLPESVTPYLVEIQSGSGSVNLTLPKDTNLKLTLDSGSGSVNVTLPSGTALSIEVLDEGSGSLNLPSGLVKANGNADVSLGIWKTEGYDTAVHKIQIVILSRGSGSVNIQ
jgi:hypothetical protein